MWVSILLYGGGLCDLDLGSQASAHHVRFVTKVVLRYTYQFLKFASATRVSGSKCCSC